MAFILEKKGKTTIFSIVILSLLVSLSLTSFVKAGEKGVTIRFGTLDAYGKHSVTVSGDKIRVCKDAVILDDNDEPTTIDGLVATETVRVKISNGCAVEVKAILIRQ